MVLCLTMSVSDSMKGDLEVGRQHLRAGRFSEAASAFRSITEQDPSNDSAWQLLGGALSQQNEWPGAVIALRKALELNPSEVRHYYNLAVALKEGLGRTHDARLYLERGLERDPDHAPSRKLLSELTPITDAPGYDQKASQVQAARVERSQQPLTSKQLALGVGAALGAGLLATALSYWISEQVGAGGVLTAIGTGWLVGLATVKGCGQGGKVPGQVAMGVAILFLLPICLFFLFSAGQVTAFRIFVYTLALFLGVQRAYITALTAR